MTDFKQHQYNFESTGTKLILCKMARTVGVISALLLACVSILCFIQYYKSNGGEPSFAMVTFAVGALYGAIIGLHEANNSVGDKTRRFIELLEDTVVVPFLATELWLKDGSIPPEAAYGHAIVAVIPVILELMDKGVKDDFKNALQVIGVVSLIIAGVLSTNYFTIGAGVAYGIGRFSFRQGKNCMDFDCTDMYNLALSGFTVCALMALSVSLQ